MLKLSSESSHYFLFPFKLHFLPLVRSLLEPIDMIIIGMIHQKSLEITKTIKRMPKFISWISICFGLAN